MTDAQAASPDIVVVEAPGEARRPHVVIVLPVYLPESTGGAERQCSILAPALRRQGWRVSVLAPTAMAALPKREDAEGVEVNRIWTRKLPFYGGKYILSTLAWTARAASWILRERKDLDVIYVFHARLHITPAVIASWITGIPLAVKLGRGGNTFDFISLNSKKFLYGAFICKLVRERAGAFIANSREIEDDLANAGVPQSRIHAIPNGVTIEPGQEGAKVDPNVLVYAGRLAPEKRLDDLFVAFAMLKRTHANLRLVIAGDGPELLHLQALSRELGAEASIEFRGQQLDMGEIYGDATYFVSASDAEGQSNALLEAMSRGLIPIVCRASGASETIEEGVTGFLFERPAAPLIVAALERAIGMSADRRAAMVLRARGKAETSFGIDAVARRTGAVLASLPRRAPEFAHDS